MRGIAVRDILVLVICVALIAGGAYFLVNRQSSNQDSVALEPIQAVPMRVPNASDSAPQPPTPIRTPDRLEPRAATPAAPTSSTSLKSDPVSVSSDAANSSVPEPSERPSDAATPSDAVLPSTSAADSSSETQTADALTADSANAIMAGTTPAALPVRNSGQGWAVQAGAFKSASNALSLRDRLLKAGLAARVEIGADGVNRVLVGAYASAEAAKASSATVAAALK